MNSTNSSEDFLENIFNRSFNKSTINILRNFVFLPLSLLADIFCIFLIKEARKTLIKIEFYLLTALTLAQIYLKIYFLSFYIVFSSKIKIKFFLCLIIYSLRNSSTQYFLTLFYYSLFHLSFISRNKHFLKLNLFIKKPKNFIKFIIVTTTISFVYSFSFAFYFQKEIFVTEAKYCSIKPEWEYGQNVNLIWDMIFETFPTILTNFTYYLCSFLIIRKIFFKKIGSSISQLRHYRRLFKVILKFCFFNTLSNVNIIVLILICVQLGFKKKLIVSYLNFFYKLFIYLTYMQSIFLLFIHVKLKAQFLEFLFKIFHKIKNVFIYKT